MFLSLTFFAVSLPTLFVIFSVYQANGKKYSLLITASGFCLFLSKECRVFIFFAYRGFLDTGCLEFMISCLVSSGPGNNPIIFLDYLGYRMPNSGISNSMFLNCALVLGNQAFR